MQADFATGDTGFRSKYAIRLWHPYGNLRNEQHIEDRYCSLGDVGTFESNGGFLVMFNIFLTKEENKFMEYCPPHDFTPFNVNHGMCTVEDPNVIGSHHMSKNFHRKHGETGYYLCYLS